VVALRDRTLAARVGIFPAKIDGFNRAQRCSEPRPIPRHRLCSPGGRPARRPAGIRSPGSGTKVAPAAKPTKPLDV